MQRLQRLASWISKKLWIIACIALLLAIGSLQLARYRMQALVVAEERVRKLQEEQGRLERRLKGVPERRSRAVAYRMDCFRQTFPAEALPTSDQALMDYTETYVQWVREGKIKLSSRQFQILEDFVTCLKKSDSLK